ncbi:hypothetical protein C1637_06165 [Chryseobacterium lactis]|uniref:Protein NO VEIN C-terminal domain-containing protein n=1 Tax=Chryseobacterium lactis TaxID=1241981 RepID=A0A3G6RIL8_CHRLC|nr:hypothetical protein [Chryseobacterium lactis]AZA84424.1 hypothetical protein EG342_22135 [Chryseobacterium lactis]AZB04812.1 hypothetical protein EG341_13015 [Chryseobacterium lactis]PNW14543.1 hypothetical protein C1637_06165 [Chryseobacterium lactis]
MTFSEHYGITPTSKDDWFDPILQTDTLLFIDPLLLSNNGIKPFLRSYEEIMEFFKNAFEIAAKSERKNSDLFFKKLNNMLLFPEVEELCLGYSTSTKGAGSGRGFSQDILNGIYNSIEAGLNNIDRFENIGLFSTGIGRDRISDITANIIKSDLINYTQTIIKRYSDKITTKKFPVRNTKFNMKTLVWEKEIVELPINPYNNKGLLLCPKKILNIDSYMSKESFLDYVWDNQNSDVRDEFSFAIKSEIDKKSIISIAKKHTDWISLYNKFMISRDFSSYDIEKDILGIYQPSKASFNYGEENPISFNEPHNQKTFDYVVSDIINYFTNYIENNSGYKLLWNDDKTAKKEEAAQLIFVALTKSLCKANNIDLNRENNLGSGPVDFKFSQGYKNKVLIEVKLAKNNRFWDGVRLQLPKYMQAEEIDKGYFLVICYSEKEIEKVKELQKISKQVSKEQRKEIIPIIVDATPDKKSASKLKE